MTKVTKRAFVIATMLICVSFQFACVTGTDSENDLNSADNNSTELTPDSTTSLDATVSLDPASSLNTATSTDQTLSNDSTTSNVPSVSTDQVTSTDQTIPVQKIGNDYPVVLCHGNGGWGRDEKSSYLYWGGKVDLEKALNDAGYKVYTGVVGPYSSNWDRACELYAYIKGGTVDYGKAHSEKFHHARFGRTYAGLYTAWGTTDADGINKIHLLGHSQGGQTVRVFAQLLEEGISQEIVAVLGLNPEQSQIDKAVSDGTLSRLFTGTCKNWAHSVSTFASPHDGTTAQDVVNMTGKQLQLLVNPINGIYLDTVTGKTLDPTYSFDLKLDQWGMTRRSGELLSSYLYRVLGSSLWLGTRDFCSYDLSTKGSKAMNTWVKDQPNIYYFSYSCRATVKALWSVFQIPDSRYMNTLFYTNAIGMGSYMNIFTGIDSKWLPNDGYVNTISENGPKTGRSTVNIVSYNGKAIKGVWNHMGILTATDHEDIIGRNISAEMGGLVDFYIEYMQMLREL